MRRSNTTTLVFLGTCLAFAETSLGLLASLTDANATLVAGFALAALGMVLTALVAMYWREPEFLILSGEQALDLRRIQAILERVPPELIPIYLNDLMNLSPQEIELGESEDVGLADETSDLEAEALEQIELMLQDEAHRRQGEA